MEYVSFGEGEGDPSDSQPDNGLGQMSEKVQAMAQNIYVELETLVRAYGPESAQAITPILVRNDLIFFVIIRLVHSPSKMSLKFFKY